METIDIQSLPITSKQCVLDLGCGEGRHSIACVYHFDDVSVFGLDLSFNDISKAHKKSTDFFQSEKITYLNGSGLLLPFADSSIDHVICSEVLEHIDDYSAMLSEIKRVLKPQGSLSVSVPRQWPETICWALSAEYHQVEGGHLRIFNARQLINEISSCGFDFHRKHWVHALHSVYWWLRCLCWNKGKDNSISAIYHQLLVWDLIKRPVLTRVLETMLNPILGKSVVLYFFKK